MEERESFKVGDVIRCASKPSFLGHLHLRVGERFVVTAVERGTYSDLLNVRREHSGDALLLSPMLPSTNFEIEPT
jgi:hypothetical protein